MQFLRSSNLSHAWVKLARSRAGSEYSVFQQQVQFRITYRSGACVYCEDSRLHLTARADRCCEQYSLSGYGWIHLDIALEFLSLDAFRIDPHVFQPGLEISRALASDVIAETSNSSIILYTVSCTPGSMSF